eukprot:g14988.t1
MLAPSCTRRTRLCGFLLTALTTSLLCAPDQALGAAPGATAASASTDVVGSTTEERDGDGDVGGLIARLGGLQLEDDLEDGSEFRAGADGSGHGMVEAPLGGGDDTDFVVEAHGLSGSFLWRHTFPGGLAQTTVRDLRDRHIAFIADGDAETSGPEVADWRSHFAVFALQLSSFKDHEGFVHQAPVPFLDANENSVNNAALKDDAEWLEFAFNRVWPPGQHANVEVKTLFVLVIAGAGCFSEKGFGVVQALLAPERTREEDPGNGYTLTNPAALRGYTAHVMRLQYFESVSEVSGRRRLARREVRVEKKENFTWSASEEEDDASDISSHLKMTRADNFVDYETGRGIGVGTLRDRHVRSGEEGDVPERGRPSGRGFDDDPPDVHAADGVGEPGIVRPIDEVRGAKWFVLPGDHGSDWIPVGEPRLFQDEVSMRTLVDEIMPKQLQIHWNPTSKEAAVHWRDGRSLLGTVSAAIWNKVPIPFLSSRSWTTTVPDYLPAEYAPVPSSYTGRAWWNKKPDYVLVHFARNSDASLFAEYMVTVDKTFGIRWRLRVFRPAWRVRDEGPPGPRLMQDNVLTWKDPIAWKDFY